jgi:hypothetical protein
MKMFAQLIINENIFWQTLPVTSEQDQRSWKLGLNVTCEFVVAFAHKTFKIHGPSLLLSAPHAPTFLVAVLRQSETEGTRLLGSIEIRRGEVLGPVESNRRSKFIPHGLSIITEDYNLALQLELNKVNPDGPSLKFSAGFSVSELPYQEVSGLDLMGIPDNTSQIPYILLNYSLSHLQLPVSRIRA